MTRPGTMLAAMLVMLTAGATAHAKMEMRTFPVLAGAGAHGQGHGRPLTTIPMCRAWCLGTRTEPRRASWS